MMIGEGKRVTKNEKKKGTRHLFLQTPFFDEPSRVRIPPPPNCKNNTMTAERYIQANPARGADAFVDQGIEVGSTPKEPSLEEQEQARRAKLEELYMYDFDTLRSEALNGISVSNCRLRLESMLKAQKKEPELFPSDRVRHDLERISSDVAGEMSSLHERVMKLQGHERHSLAGKYTTYLEIFDRIQAAIKSLPDNNG